MKKSLIAMLAALGISASIAEAADPPKDAFYFPVRLYLLLLGTALLGGFVGWYTKVMRGELQWTSMHHLIGELTTSAFAGLLVFWLCEASGVPALVEAPMVGMAGYTGAKAIAWIESFLYKRFGMGLHERRNSPPKTGPGDL